MLTQIIRIIKRATVLVPLLLLSWITFLCMQPIPAPRGKPLTHPWKSSFVRVNGVRLHVVEAGPQDGKVILFLHGFPEFWYEWKAQIRFFTARGYRVIVPDQRGYNKSAKPRGAHNYTLPILARDMVELIRLRAASKPVMVVGHDWGAAVTWHLAHHYPQFIARAVVINVPHHQVMAQALRTDRAQLRRSWYMFLFQVPVFGERAMAIPNWRGLAYALTKTGRPGTFSRKETDQYRHAWAQPGAITGMLNWYRAAFRFPVPYPKEKIEPPVLVIWGPQDQALGKELASKSVALCRQGRLVYIPGASHWVIHEEPDRVNAEILKFVQP